MGSPCTGGIASLSACFASDATCVWQFASEDGSSEGRCFSFSNCSWVGLDTYNEMQTTGAPPFDGEASGSAEWLLPSLHQCLELSASRKLVGASAWTAFVYLILFVLIHNLKPVLRLSADEERAAPEQPSGGGGGVLSAALRCVRTRGYNHFCGDRSSRYVIAWVILGVMSCVLVGISVQIAWDDRFSNVLLLPSFALFALTVEGMHYMPTNASAGHSGGGAHAPVDDGHSDGDHEAESPPSCTTRGACRRWRASRLSTIECIGLVSAASLLSALQAASCSIFLVGMMVQFSAFNVANFEAEAVRAIAWIDVVSTLVHAILLAAAVPGSHHFRIAPWALASITFAFAAALCGVAIGMDLSCTPDQYLTADNSAADFEGCTARFVGRAYALAFVSILRQIVIAFADTSAPECATRPLCSSRGTKMREEEAGSALFVENHLAPALSRNKESASPLIGVTA